MINCIWRKIWFMDDDDNTPQGKLGRGCFYTIYMAAFFLLMVGGAVPAILWAVGEIVEHFTP